MRGPKRLGLGIRGADRGGVDIGDEPPLMIAETPEDHPAMRSVSLRWLTGTVLTGFISIFLMGGALMAALNNPNQFASLAEAAVPDDGPSADARLDLSQKSDRIQPVHEEISNRQVLQVSTVTKQGERDFIKLRPFAKIIASLSTADTTLASDVPAYDAIRIFTDTSTEEAKAAAGSTTPADDQIYGADVDGDVSVKVTDFPATGLDVDTTVGFATDDAEAVVRATIEPDAADTHVAALPFIDPTRFTDEQGGNDPFSALGVRIIPENVSNIAKSATEEGDPGVQEKVIAVAKGESFRAILGENDVGDDDADHIISALTELVDLNRLHVGQRIRIAYAATDADVTKLVPIRVSIYDDGAHQATIARADDNGFVRADEPAANPDEIARSETETGSFGALPRLYDAVYETALAQQVPKQLIGQLIRMFAYDVDFQARISPGDTLELFHSISDGDPDSADPEILYAALTLNGTTKRFYRFRTSDDGVVDFYDEEGKSAKKFLMRKPMTVGIVRSGFGMRKHPILGYVRLHPGVDYAAPRGTPILAAGNGVIEKVGPTSGYGNFILIKHTNGYETGYGHQSAFAKGIVPGVRVRQGQIIGYVGSTGLSTGPHLHFEIRVNGTPVDPLRIRLPRGRVLQDDLLVAFESERERIDNLLGNTAPPAKVASANSD